MDQISGQPSEKLLQIFPDVGSCYSHGWKQMRKYFPESLLVLLLAFIISIPSWGLAAAEEIGISLDSISPGLAVVIAYLYILSFGYAILIQGPLEFGISFAFLKAARNDRLKIMAMFEVFKSNYLHAILAGILYAFIVLLGLIFLIIPGIIFACKLAFVPYLIVDRKMNAIEAINESWRMTTGHAFTVFLIGFVAIFVAIGGVIFLIVGIIPAIIWIELAFASLYHSVSTSEVETGLQTVA